MNNTTTTTVAARGTCPECGGPLFAPGPLAPADEQMRDYCWRCGWGDYPDPARYAAIAARVNRRSLAARLARLQHRLVRSRRHA